MEKEVLHFKIGLSGATDKKSPEFSILLNDKQFINSKLSSTDIEYFEFDAEIEEGDCSLVINFLNKEDSDTVKDSNNEIIEDFLLNIESIEIDEIDMGALKWTICDYKPAYSESYKTACQQSGQPLEDSVKNCVNLGWNGKWIFPFQSPFYIWLLENL